MSLEATTINASYKAALDALTSIKGACDGRNWATANTLLEQAKLSALKAVPAGDKNYTPSQLAVIDAYSHLNQVLANIPLSEEDPGAKTMMDDARSDISKSLGWVLQGLQTGPSPPPARLPHQA